MEIESSRQLVNEGTDGHRLPLLDILPTGTKNKKTTILTTIATPLRVSNKYFFEAFKYGSAHRVLKNNRFLVKIVNLI